MTNMKSQNKRPKGQNPAKTLKRLMGIILKNYTPHCIVVLLCIFGSAFVSVKGTLFMQTLIDDYILPLMSQSRYYEKNTYRCFYSYGKSTYKIF